MLLQITPRVTQGINGEVEFNCSCGSLPTSPSTDIDALYREIECASHEASSKIVWSQLPVCLSSRARQCTILGARIAAIGTISLAQQYSRALGEWVEKGTC